MSQSNFFTEHNNKEVEVSTSPLTRNLLIIAISLVYGMLAVFIAIYFLEMSGITIFMVASIYTYGILGGLAILMLIKLFNRAEESSKMLIDILDYDNNPYAITDQKKKYLYTNKAWNFFFGEGKTLSDKDLSLIFDKPHILRQQLQLYLKNIEESKDVAPKIKASEFSYIGNKKGSDKVLKLSISGLPNWNNCREWRITDITLEYNSENNYLGQPVLQIFDKINFGIATIAADGKIIEYNKMLEEIFKLENGSKYYLHKLLDITDACKQPYIICGKDCENKGDWQSKIVTVNNSKNTILALNKITDNRDNNTNEICSYLIVIPTEMLGGNIVNSDSKNLAEDNAREESFRDIFIDAPLGMCIIRSDMMLEKTNSAFRKLIEREDIKHTSLLALILKEQHETAQQWLESVFDKEHKRASSLELSLIHNKGQVPVRVYVHRLDKDRLALYFVDLTEQKNLEQQFTQSQKMQGIGQLAGGIAHDFNNLLTAMIGFCDLLLLRHKPGDPSFSDIMQIKQNANRAANLVRQLLAFSRQQTLQPKVLDITDVLSDLMHLMQRLIGANINLDIKHGQNLWPVKCDEGQLEQVLINLVVNARDAMKDGGELVITTENYTNKSLEQLNEEEYLPIGNWVAIKVKDTGTGIVSEVLSRIFEPFFSTKEIGAGTGLGLSTVHGIIHQTGGYLAVHSIVGEGTTFTIYLPRYQKDDGNTSEDKASSDDISENKNANNEVAEDLTGTAAIMLVEDEDAVRVFSSRALSNKGYKIIDAPNGEVAMEIMEKQKDIKLELLITDVIMPEMDGPTLAKNIRRLYPDLKIIFMSGYSEDRFKEEFGKNTYFLQKPFTLRVLAKTVKDVLDGENE